MLYGIHAVEAALANPRRTIGRLLATENAARRLEAALKARGVKVEDALPKQLDRLLGSDAVHQGVVLETEPLPPVELEDVRPEGILLVLDQVTDPQNVGAVLRSAAAFGAAGVVLPERHTPPFTGALAKAASGALDIVPVILIGNLAQSLAQLGEAGFLRVGLAEEGAEPLETASLTLPARPGAWRRRQRLAPAHARDMRPALPHLDQRAAREPQRLERSGHRAPLGKRHRSVKTEFRVAELFHLAATASRRRIVEIRHAAGIAVIGRRIGPVEPPIVSRIAVIGRAARPMAVEDDALDRFAEA